MRLIAPGVWYADLMFSGMVRAIGTGVYAGPDGVALVDPGPGSCSDTLIAALNHDGYGVGDIRTILLTHIHLDHAGATGRFVQANPDIRVYVHERGAPHVLDPSKLINSANQLWGVEGVARLWGAALPVPESNVTVLRGGEKLDVVGRLFEVAYTPGHATHHVSYFDRAARLAWVGDTVGVRFGDVLFSLPPTPPPDIDVEAWYESLGKIRKWNPETIFVTHCGAYAQARAHIDQYEESLRATVELARQVFESGESDEAQAARFVAEVERVLYGSVARDQAGLFQAVAPIEFSWRGLARYWRKRREREAAAQATV